MSDNTLWTWGFNVITSSSIYSYNPLKKMDNVIAISSNHLHAMAITANGNLWAWGHNHHGELGSGVIGNRDEYVHEPIRVMRGVVAVSAGAYYTMAVKADGSLWGWGKNDFGQLGNGAIINHDGYVPESVPSPIYVMSDVTAVSAGVNHTMAIKTDGSLWGWGANWRGQLGDGTTICHTNPVHLMDNVTAVSVGYLHTLVICADGNLWTWGGNYSGQLGHGDIESHYSYNPKMIMSDVIAISAGHEHSTAITADGTLWVWGDNWRGQLGNVHLARNHTPAKIMDDVIAVSAGSRHTTAIRADGSLWEWGDNLPGSIFGDPTPAHIMDGARLP